MVGFKKKYPKLDLNIEFDETTGLPLLSEQDKILDLIRTYLFLPYTIAEYGCGKKCSIIIHKLVDLGIPPYAIKRGMIMEKDMSADALKEQDFTKRPHALIIENPLYHPKDFYREILFDMLDQKVPGTQVDPPQIKVDDYVLLHHKELQFVQARSHIFSVITFWEASKNRAVEYVLDPTINPDALFEIEDLRDLLHDDEALLFTAPLLGRFRLDARYMTYWQKQQLRTSGMAISMDRLSLEKHNAFIRLLNQAPEGSIGDPETWMYNNNICTGEPEVDEEKRRLTGKGDVFNSWRTQLLKARKEQRGEVISIREKLWSLVEKLDLYAVIRQDAKQAEVDLEPLARVENTIAYYRAIRQLVNWWQRDFPLPEIVRKLPQLRKLAGISMRLRHRIEVLAEVSSDEDGRIDARALTPRFVAATLETIEQMNTAGLSVFIDEVGNIHGLKLPQATDPRSLKESAIRKFCASSISHCSHIDTVFDGGKYDGRLGVLAGIEMAHILKDLKSYFDFSLKSSTHRSMFVSAFIGEEMTFTGQNVSMPGSAAVTGAAKVSAVHQMTNSEGAKFVDKLLELLRILKQEQGKGRIQLVNTFESAGSDEALLKACYSPNCFFSAHTYERHIEQGPVLDRRRVPTISVDTIMGIHQEDFHFSGTCAEEGALAFNQKLRELALLDQYEDIRITVGVLKGEEESRKAHMLDFGLRVQLSGEVNHAGATLMTDRKDPGVAVARTAQFFSSLIEELNIKRAEQLEVLIGEVEFLPGANRNVIPGSAALTLGVQGSISSVESEYIRHQLHAWIIDTLLLPVGSGGEGVLLRSLDPINFLGLNKAVTLSIDLRAGRETSKNIFLQDAKEHLMAICHEYDLSYERQVEQELSPYSLRESGQVLQIERSYGGSHNPDEAQLEKDLLIGSLFQLEVTRRFMEAGNRNKKSLFEMLEEFIPTIWKERLPRFVSGALHDTCNIAAKMTKSLASATTKGKAASKS